MIEMGISVVRLPYLPSDPLFTPASTPQNMIWDFPKLCRASYLLHPIIQDAIDRDEIRQRILHTAHLEPRALIPSPSQK